MSQSLSSEQDPSNVGGSERNESRRVALAAVGILLALMVAVLALRFQRLSELPPGLVTDEGANGVSALRVLRGEHAVFFPEKGSGREGLAIYAIALTTAFLGRTLLAMHLPAALASAGTVFAVFWLGRLFFGQDEESGRATPWRGLLVGGVGAGLLAVSVGQTFLARMGYRANFLPPVLCLCIALLWWAWRQRVRHGGTWQGIALAGACAGLLPYTYISARFTPLLFFFFGLSFLLPCGAGLRAPLQMARHCWARCRAELPWLGVFVGVAGVVAAPLLIYFALNPEHFFIRSDQLRLFGGSPGENAAAFLKNVWDYLLVFGFHGDPHPRYNFAGRSMLNLWEAFFFWLGVGMAVWRWQRRPAYRLLLLWLCILILPAMLADTSGQGPNTIRIIGAAPAIYLLIGVGIWEAFLFLTERRRALRWRANPVFLENETWTAIAVGALICFLILGKGVTTYRTFFQEWAGNPAFYTTYHGEWTDAAQVLNAQPSAAEMIYILPYPTSYEHFGDEHYGFEYLYQGTAPAQVVAATTPHNLAQKIESTLAAMENVATVNYVDWDNDLVGGDAKADEHVAVLLGKYGRYLGSEEFVNFQIHSFSDISLDHPWTIYEQLEPLTVHFDGGISLHGLALGQGEEQLSSQQLLSQGVGRSLWVALQWQAAPGLEIDYSISLAPARC